MAGMTDYSAQNWLNYVTGKAAMPALGGGNVYLGLFTTAPTSDAGVTGAVEVTTAGGSAYARKQTLAADWNSAVASAGSEPRVTPAAITNANAFTFAVAQIDWGTITSFGLFDAVTAGNLLAWDYLGAYPWVPFSCSLASPGLITAPGHAMVTNDSAVVTAKQGGTLPTTAGSWAGIKTVANVVGDTFNLGVNTTSTGDGMVRRVLQQAAPRGSQISFAINSLAINAA